MPNLDGMKEFLLDVDGRLQCSELGYPLGLAMLPSIKDSIHPIILDTSFSTWFLGTFS